MRTVLSGASFYIFLCVLCLAPLPYGSRDPETVSVWCALLGFALVLAPVGQMRAPQRLLSWGLVILAVALSFVLHEQLAQNPWIAKPLFVWTQARQVLDIPLDGSASLVRDEPFFSIGPILADIMVLWLGLIHGCDRRAARRALWFVTLSSLVYALIGIAGLMIDPGRLLFREREAFVGYLTATFVDRNTAAVYFGSVSVLWLLFLLREARRILPGGFSRKVYLDELFIPGASRKIWGLFAGLLICLLSLFLSGSRAGIVISLAILALAATLYVSLEGLSRRRFILIFAIAGGCCIGLLVLLGGTLNARFNLDGAGDGGRWAIYLSTLRLIHDYPWFGTGLGTYQWAIPAYRSADLSLWGIWNRAHNSLLEIAAELGAPLAALITVLWLAALFILARGIFTRRRDQFIPLAALSIALIGLLHSMVEFSLQVQGYAIIVMGLTGVGLAQSFRPESSDAGTISIADKAYK